MIIPRSGVHGLYIVQWQLNAGTMAMLLAIVCLGSAAFGAFKIDILFIACSISR